jgi:DNA (cytosine-5)-methyltransferase 1
VNNRKSTKSIRPTAISFFSGAGGMDLGFLNAGFDVRLAIEIDPSCCDTLRINLQETYVLEGDICKVSPERIAELSRLKPGEIDCIFGGPPCQSFSLAGRREGLNDERGRLVFRFIELVRSLRPKTFVLENVKGMVNWQGGVVLREIEKMLESPLETGEQYQVKHRVLNAADYGVAQSRERVIIVGTRVPGSQDFYFNRCDPKQKGCGYKANEYNAGVSWFNQRVSMMYMIGGYAPPRRQRCGPPTINSAYHYTPPEQVRGKLAPDHFSRSGLR